MIVTLAGTVTQKEKDFAIIEVHGVGFQVMMSRPSLETLRAGAEARLWTHEYLREDARELYGFSTSAEHRLFRRLLAVSGVGPKTALHLLELGTVRDIEMTIERGDVGRLSSVSGVGKKTAQKIVIELKGKFSADGDETGDGGDVLTALINLGYSRERAREVLTNVSGKETTVEGRLKAALRQLGR